MPWTQDHYPDSMDGLDPEVREAAIEIANRLVDEGYTEAHAIAIAQAQAGATGEAEDPVEAQEERPGRSGRVPPLVERSETMLAEHDAEPPEEDHKGRPQPASGTDPGDDEDPDEDEASA